MALFDFFKRISKNENRSMGNGVIGPTYFEVLLSILKKRQG
jgi:hypothetical protein